jgi:hypothetical protein
MGIYCLVDTEAPVTSIAQDRPSWGEVAMFETIANMKLSDVLSRPPTGAPVNVHVVSPPREPVDDFAAMRRLVHGDDHKPLPSKIEEAVPRNR